MKILTGLFKLIGAFICFLDRVIDRFRREYIKSKFRQCGKNVYIGKNGIFTHSTISIGDDVYIGANACLQSQHGEIKIGDHVMFGPGVHIHGGNHVFSDVGKYMKHVEKKESDGTVVIEDDCWLGANVIVLKNCVIGRGSVVGAGSVVTKSLPPYSIYTGVPELKQRKRFTEVQIEEHERLLYGDG